MILLAPQQATSHGFNAPPHPQNICPFSSKCHSEDRAGSWRENIMITVFFTAKKLIVFTVLARGGTFNSPYLINNIFPDLKTANLNFRRQKKGSTFWVGMNNSICHNGSKVTPKIKKNHISGMPYQPHSLDIGCPTSGVAQRAMREVASHARGVSKAGQL
jgi:hypothetical protein